MSIQILPLNPSDVPTWTIIHTQAFGSTPNDAIFRLRPYSSSTLANFTNSRLQALAAPNTHVFKAVEPHTNTILGIASWMIYPERRTEEEVTSAFVTPMAPEYHQEGVDAFFRALYASRMETMGMRPHVLLSVLVVDPAQQRRGVGTALVRWGVEKADELGLEAYMEASLTGRGLYERFGFEVVGEYSFDLEPWGGVGRSEHVCMIRKPRKIMIEPEILSVGA